MIKIINNRLAATVIALCVLLGQKQAYATTTVTIPQGPIPLEVPNSEINAKNFPSGTSQLPDVIAKILPAVVNISITQKQDKSKEEANFDDPYELFRELFERKMGVPERNYKSTEVGSGFIMDPSGYIVTNNHVVDKADEIKVTLEGNQNVSYKAKLIGKDAKTDIALIKIESKTPLPYLEFEDADNSRIGDGVIAVGNPFGLGGTVTTGIISAKARHIGATTYEDYIQTDASINRGNSGGPLCNASNAKVIGINSAILTTTGGSLGIGFAVPSYIAQPVLKQLKEHGSVSRGLLGVKIQSVDEKIAKSLRLPQPTGALVAEIVEGSPAAKGGVKVGDVITKFDDKPIVDKNKLPLMVANTPIGKKVVLEVFRDGTTQKLEIIVEKQTDEPSDATKTKPVDRSLTDNLLGIAVQNITPALRQKYHIADKDNGIVVVDISNDSVAAATGLRPGDVIAAVNQKVITDIKDFKQILDKSAKSKDSAIILLVSRGGNQIFMAIEIDG